GDGGAAVRFGRYDVASNGGNTGTRGGPFELLRWLEVRHFPHHGRQFWLDDARRAAYSEGTVVESLDTGDGRRRSGPALDVDQLRPDALGGCIDGQGCLVSHMYHMVQYAS